MNRTRWRLLVACLAVIGAAIAVAGGSAGNRDGLVTFKAEPGPGAVTYGENIAYSSTFDNTTGNSTFTQVRYVQTRPTATFIDAFGAKTIYTADLEKTSCAAGAWFIDGKNDTDRANDEFVCNVQSQLKPADDPAKVVTVWSIPADIAFPSGCLSCLKSTAWWLIKERKATNGNETFPNNPGPAVATAQLLAGEGSEETLRAGGYELGACTAIKKSLSTNQDVNEDNPVATSFCLPPFETSGVNVGIATTITEIDAHTSEVCIADLGATCPASTEDAKDFGPAFVTFEFRVAADALPNGYKITQVFHNSPTALPKCDPDPNVAPGDNGCVVSINLVNDQGKKTWVIIARSETNGPWTW